MNDRKIPLSEPREIIEDADYVSVPDTEKFHLRSYWRILVERRWLIALMFLISLGLGTYIAYTATPVYTARALIKIEPQAPMVTGTAGIDSSSGGGDYYQTQYAILEGRRLASEVIKTLNVGSDPAFSKSVVTANPVARIRELLMVPLRPLFELSSFAGNLLANKQEPAATATSSGPVTRASESAAPGVKPWMVNHYLSLLKVRPVKGTRLVQIEFTTPSAGLSQELANAHAQAYIRMNYSSHFELTKEAKDFLDKKQEELRGKLERSESALNAFRQEHGIVSLEKGENIDVDRLVDVNRQLNIARGERLQAEALHRTVTNRDPQYLSQIITSPLVAQLRATLTTLEADQARAAITFKPDHPRMIELAGQISEAKRHLNVEISNQLRVIDTTLTEVRTREATLQAEANHVQQKALSLKHLGVQYAVLAEEAKINRSLYESVVRRLNETTLSNDLALSNIQLAEPAERPNSASAPQRQGVIMLTMTSGLFLAICLAFFMDYLDSSLKSSDDIWRTLLVPTLGVVPDTRSLRNRIYGYAYHDRSFQRFLPHLRRQGEAPNPRLLVNHHPLSLIAESYRSIRTTIQLSEEKSLKVILVTSAQPGEGKTLSTINLAITFATNGQSVLVVDGDMRKGSGHRLLKTSSAPGLADVLKGAATLENSIQSTEIDNFWFLPRGSVPSNPADLLCSAKLAQLVQIFRSQFDVVLIDSPPAIAVSDATVLATLSDGIVLVVRSQRTSMESARRALLRLQASNKKITGAILNAVDIRSPDYADYKQYYTSYYEETNPEALSMGAVAVRLPLAGKDGLSRNGAIQQPRDSGRSLADKPVDWLTSELAEVIGPLAPIIVEEVVREMGETRARFPGTRVSELADLLSRSIADARSRSRFQEKVQVVFNGGENAPIQHEVVQKSVNIANEDTSEVNLDWLTAHLNEVIGPMARMLIEETIGELRESAKHFPARRLEELVSRLKNEIPTVRDRAIFEERVASFLSSGRSKV